METIVHIKNKPYLLCLIGVLVFLPFIILEIFAHNTLFISLVRMLSLLSVFLFTLLVMSYVSTKNKKLRILISILFSLYFVGMYLISAYVIITKKPLNLFFVLNAGFYTSITTLIKVFGGFMFFFILILLIVIFFVICKSLNKTPIHMPELTLKKIGILFIISLLFISQSDDFMTGSVTSSANFFAKENFFRPYNEYRVIDDSTLGETSFHNDSVFILQLESLNSFVVNENTTPNMFAIAKEGTFFKQFYANSMETNRARANMLCGVYDNIAKAYSFRPEELKNKKTCLPEFLKQQGYKTLAFRSSDLDFANEGNFLKAIGFDEIHYTDIMKKEDEKYHFYWGYDDSIFYKRVFEYLNENYKDQKVFVFIEVSAHHYPFRVKAHNQGEKLPLTNPKNLFGHYVNSLFVQDEALEIFYKLFQESWAKRSHLFILGDTSWPVNRELERFFTKKEYYEDHFLTSMVFVPKQNSYYARGQSTEHLEKRFSQTDMVLSILDLLTKESKKAKGSKASKKQYQNSFEPLLRLGVKNEDALKDYENCHVLINPYLPPSIIIIKYPFKYVYIIEQKKLLKVNLKQDPQEEKYLFKSGVDRKSFFEDHLCERFK